MLRPIRVVIVDDSTLMQRVLTGLLEQDTAIQIIGTASNGRDAIALVERLRPDVVIMDVHMPIMDGLETTAHLMATCPTPILVLTALAQYDVDITFKMLGAGALDVVEKPRDDKPLALARQSHDLIRRVKLLARVKVVRHLRGRKRSEEAEPHIGTRFTSPALTNPAVTNPALQRRGHEAPAVLAERRPNAAANATRDSGFPVLIIGASTGGPRVVNQILSSLPSGFPAAVVVVQHIAEGFSAGMAEWLGLGCRLPVVVATEHLVVKPGQVLIAPDRSDLLLEAGGIVHLSKSALLLQRPSIDVAMQAAAAVFGRRCTGVLLTGMGRDGAYGMLTVRRAGGHTIAQDQDSSAIFGMPKAAIELGAAAEVLPAAQIAGRLIELVRTTTATPISK
ncbi:MAG: chemotaxis-specific protein-glutamate methyltransferase CheB [Roseiflexaceae bacterium]|nr:chemotaxis-specific protein-glutamate methyltransferase CheB [Roseiflexaceae bacterium]